ncbi:CS1 fimbrial subunit B flags: Precursor [Stenotrophomonas sp. ISL-67]|uniref:CS1 fimbrial subunit B flags: Precursor n=1 Tax=Stenotrophomonas sp. ISL-67 TaxID=2819171 RepID=UPI001BE7EB5F|nr:CS1 fimbrial subunit B flags: Precursor [Stenotrophomonas sp. ISL-67]MBT2767413.1 CS1 fimbrial subunit B flags: Precursor [Stenotrophomonas sp. ISL-67]
MKRLMTAMALVLAMTGAQGTAHAAAPNIHVGAMYEYAEPGKGALLKRVRNTGDATAFVRVQITEVRYAADGSHHEVPVTGTDAGLIASPSRLIVPAQGQQATRLLVQGDRSAERYYRVRFVPVLPQSEDEFALTDAQRDEYRKELSAGVNVLTGYGVFVIVHPDQTRYDVQTETHDGYVQLRNAGNTTVILDDIRQCSTQDKAAKCSPSRKVHLLPQRTERFTRSAEHLHRFQIVEGNDRKDVQLNP